MFCTGRSLKVGPLVDAAFTTAYSGTRRPNCNMHRVYLAVVANQMKRYFSKKFIPLAIGLMLGCDGWTPLVRAQSVPARIDIIVVEGEGAAATTRQRLTHDPVVRVEDDDHQPIAGAAVVFVLPVSGSSGEFEGGSKSLTVVTGNDGVAAARGIRANQIPGKLQIYVTASYRGLRARGLITQSIESAPGVGNTASITEIRASKSGGGRWKWVLLGVCAAAGAGAGVYYGTRTSNSPISISTGTVVFGSPR